MSVSVVLADDHPVVRSGLRQLLDSETGIAVLAETSDTAAALRAVLGHKPDVLLLDLNMPGYPSSLEAIPLVKERSPQTATVILTMQEDPEYARGALRAGALGYVLKEAANSELVQAVRLAAAGECYLTPSLGAKLAAQPEEPVISLPDGLTPREAEILKLIVRGHTNTEIGRHLLISSRTVETHRASLQRKTGCHSRAELVTYAGGHDGLRA